MPSLLRTLLLVGIVFVSLVVIDSVLAKMERTARATEASRFYREGLALVQQGKNSEAAASFKLAIEKERDNPEYRLALGRALRGAGQLNAAAATFAELLNGDSMGGAPNLAMARVYAKEGRIADAAAYYHRAIYGQWKDNAQENELKARFELVDFLAARDAKPELLAELLALQNLAPSDPATQDKMARLYLTAGSPGRAAAILRDLVHTDPQDVEAHETLAKAEFALGNYAAARAASMDTLRMRPGDKGATRQLQLSGEILDLDPTERGLPEHERYRRSTLILQRALDDAARCLDASQSGEPADLVNAARAELKRRVDPAQQGDAVEENLDLANKLWKTLKLKCASGTVANDDALNLLLARIAQ